jgi:hypothetical protein
MARPSLPATVAYRLPCTRVSDVQGLVPFRYRQRYLEQWGVEEDNKLFLQYSQGVEVDWEKINAKKKQEKEKELARK